MKRLLAVLLLPAALAAHAQIATGSATVGAGGIATFPEQTGRLSGVRVVAQMRESDPTVMDVDYIVYANPDTTPTVNVRALAFEDGERGFATVVRPETFIEGTDANIGDGIAANVAHRLSWKVSSDWATDLAKVKFEVMAMKPGDLLLPDMHFVTIPAAEGHPKTIVSVNNLSVGMSIRTSGDVSVYYRWWNGYDHGMYEHTYLLQALFWIYAGHESDITLTNGSLYAFGKELVRHAAFEFHFSGTHNGYMAIWNWSCNPNAIRYVFAKLGYRLLDDSDEVAWIIENTRLKFQPQGFRQYAVKTVEE